MNKCGTGPRHTTQERTPGRARGRQKLGAPNVIYRIERECPKRFDESRNGLGCSLIIAAAEKFSCYQEVTKRVKLDKHLFFILQKALQHGWSVPAEQGPHKVTRDAPRVTPLRLRLYCFYITGVDRCSPFSHPVWAMAPPVFKAVRI